MNKFFDVFLPVLGGGIALVLVAGCLLALYFIFDLVATFIAGLKAK